MANVAFGMMICSDQLETIHILESFNKESFFRLILIYFKLVFTFFQVDENEARSRMQAHRLIQLVASAGWLPNALASSAEIVSVIDGADIADLLLLVWRCMHHAVAFGSKVWGGSSSNLQGTRSSTDGQVLDYST